MLFGCQSEIFNNFIFELCFVNKIQRGSSGTIEHAYGQRYAQYVLASPGHLILIRVPDAPGFPGTHDVEE